MSKAITLVLVVLALSVLVVGCGGAPATAPADGSADASDAATQEEAAVIDGTVFSESDDVEIGELIE